MSNARYGFRTFTTGEVRTLARKGVLPFVETGTFIEIFGQPAAALSLRRLAPIVTNCIRVRRSSDNAEQDIGFVGSAADSAIDTTDLLTFVGAGNDGFVTTWYDQSSAGRNATQSTGANQPKIVDSGSIILSNGNPAMQFPGLTTFLQFSSNFSTFTNTSVFSITEPTTYSGAAGNARYYDLYDGTSHIQYLRDSSSSRLHVKNDLWQSGNNATQFTTQNAPTTQFISSVLALSSSNDLYFDTSLQSKTAISIVGSAGSIGTIGIRADSNNSTQFIGNYQEIIIYQSDMSTERGDIELNIDNHYNVL
jgi:hypothetical protein